MAVLDKVLFKVWGEGGLSEVRWMCWSSAIFSSFCSFRASLTVESSLFEDVFITVPISYVFHRLGKSHSRGALHRSMMSFANG